MTAKTRTTLLHSHRIVKSPRLIADNAATCMTCQKLAAAALISLFDERASLKGLIERQIGHRTARSLRLRQSFAYCVTRRSTRALEVKIGKAELLPGEGQST